MLGGVAGGRLDGNGSLLAEGKRWIWTPGHPVVNPDRLTPHGAVAVDPTCDARAPTYRLVFRILNARWSMVYVNTKRGHGNSILVSNLVRRLSFYLGRFERERKIPRKSMVYLTNYLFRLVRQLYSISREKEEIRIFEKNIFFDYRSDDMINDKMDIYNVCFEEQPERKTIASISENH